MNKVERAYIISDAIAQAEAKIRNNTGEDIALIAIDRKKDEVKNFLEIVTKALGSNPNDIREKCRTTFYAHRRFICCRLLTEYYPGLALNTIRRHLGYTHHSSVLHGLKECARLLTEDKEFDTSYKVALAAVTQFKKD